MCTQGKVKRKREAVLVIHTIMMFDVEAMSNAMVANISFPVSGLACKKCDFTIQSIKQQIKLK